MKTENDEPFATFPSGASADAIWRRRSRVSSARQPLVGRAADARTRGRAYRAAWSVTLFAAALQFAYQKLIAPLYEYGGLGYRSPAPLGYAAVLVVTWMVAVLLPPKIRHPSDFVLWMFFCLVGAPSMLIAQYNSRIPATESVPTAIAVGATMALLCLGTLARPKSARQPLVLPMGLLWTGLLSVAVLTDAALLITSGISVGWLSLKDVYALRSDFTEFYTALPLLGYLVPLTANVVNPLLMAQGLLRRQVGFLVAGVLGQYVLYATTGNKAILFSIPAIIALAISFKSLRAVNGPRLLISIAVLAQFASLLNRLTTSTIWTDLVLRRFLIVPGALTSAYVTVFFGHAKTNFGDSPLHWITPYSGPAPALLVGRDFVGDVTTVANASLFGHGYAAYGYPGILIEGLALVPVLWLLDTAGRGLPPRVFALVLFMPVVALASATVFTSMLTHGLLASAAILAVLPRTGWDVEKRPISGRQAVTTTLRSIARNTALRQTRN